MRSMRANKSTLNIEVIHISTFITALLGIIRAETSSYPKIIIVHSCRLETTIHKITSSLNLAVCLNTEKMSGNLKVSTRNPRQIIRNLIIKHHSKSWQISMSKPSISQGTTITRFKKGDGHRIMIRKRFFKIQSHPSSITKFTKFLTVWPCNSLPPLLTLLTTYQLTQQIISRIRNKINF